MAGTFRPQRGWSLDWEGGQVLATLVEASRRGIDEVSERGANMARFEHPWENETGQTEASVFVRKAEVEVHGTTPDAIPHVWGEWGVEDRPRYKFEKDDAGRWVPSLDETGNRIPVANAYNEDGLLSTKDVALFLEFGTVKMFARPWLYPAWDATKVTLPATIARYYAELAATGGKFRVRNAAGQFISLAGGK